MARRGPQSFRLHLGASHVDVEARHLNDGGLLIQVCPACFHVHVSQVAGRGARHLNNGGLHIQACTSRQALPACRLGDGGSVVGT